MKDLKNTTIVITGASSGAGRAAALKFAQHQCTLVLAARNETALNEVKGECEELGATVFVVPTDTSDAKAMIALANSVNGIDVWINNAGVLAAGDFDKTPMAIHEQVIKTNLIGYMNGAHAVLPIFKQQGAGILINNISIGGFLPVPYGAGYTAAKFGLRGWSEALKGELTECPNIHICDLFPAFLDTPGILHAGNHTGKVLKPAPPVYDPNRLADAMVSMVQDPRSNKYVGSTSMLLKVAHAIAPELMTKMTGLIMRRYLKNADPIKLTDGNLFNTVDYGMSTHGGFGLPGKPKAHRKYIAAALATGITAGLWLFKK
ncbi:Short-chain dehydrogenase [Mucilaginibacter pineti]|uniref:Short-chain dehydrogenase n=1 Tax=Mucilaginibacter pineti TaxID=1391627 RepID=A0A1G7H933_9SPHI|nr:SDR family oxidoreductase [Mucilaginibacter pineti]SDE96629.1 Short-chain dehydrogenase [Mucilaginibacter pineti]